MRGSRAIALGVAAVCVALPNPVRADEVPQPLALTVMLKVLTYDAEFARHGQGAFVVLVPYVPRDENAARQTVATAEGLEQKTILGRPLKYAAVPLAELEVRVAELHPSALLALRGTTEPSARELARVSAAFKLYTLSLQPELVEQLLALGVGTKEGRPQVVINIAAARASGADFKPTVLKVARTVQ